MDLEIEDRPPHKGLNSSKRFTNLLSGPMSLIFYFHLSNNRGGWNKRGGEAKIAESLNVEAGINVEVGKYS